MYSKYRYVLVYIYIYCTRTPLYKLNSSVYPYTEYNKYYKHSYEMCSYIYICICQNVIEVPIDDWRKAHEYTCAPMRDIDWHQRRDISVVLIRMPWFNSALAKPVVICDTWIPRVILRQPSMTKWYRPWRSLSSGLWVSSILSGGKFCFFIWVFSRVVKQARGEISLAM